MKPKGTRPNAAQRKKVTSIERRKYSPKKLTEESKRPFREKTSIIKPSIPVKDKSDVVPKAKVKSRGLVTSYDLFMSLIAKNQESGKIKHLKNVTTSIDPKKIKTKSEQNLSFKAKFRRQVWNLSKSCIKRNRRWSQMMKDNNIDVDKINIDKLDLNIINVEGLGIENKFVKNAIVWLLK